ncbi:MAG: AbrB family transcriptional regulator [Pseudomonadota bacterium]|nr:AbrB family transcriptional regulator [Pseudomonadota bacterium]
MTFTVSKACQVVGLIVATVIVAAVLHRLSVPGSMLLGALLAGIGFGLAGSRIDIPRKGFDGAQAVLACVIASYADLDQLVQDPSLLGWAVLSSLVTVAAGLCASVVAVRVGGLTLQDAIWGFMPAVAGAMIAMSEGRANDSRIVAVIQIIRLMTVIAALGLVSTLMSETPLPRVPHQDSGFPVALGLVVIIPFLAPSLRRIPAFSFIGTLAVAMIAGQMGVETGLPQPVVLLAFAVVGWQVGLRFNADVLRQAGAAIPAILAGSAVLLLCGAVMAGVVVTLTDHDGMTGFLATVPGSLDSLSIIAVQTHADLTFVLSLQVTRMFTILFLTPLLSALLLKRGFGAPRRT